MLEATDDSLISLNNNINAYPTIINKNENIKGLLVVVNSPGGTFVSSKEVYDTLEKISKKIPTSVYMREIATSGAYLASLGVDKIFANNGTITGSIGVILQTAELTSLLEKLGIASLLVIKYKAMLPKIKPVSSNLVLFKLKLKTTLLSFDT